MVHKLKRAMKKIYAKASIKSSYLAHLLNRFKDLKRYAHV